MSFPYTIPDAPYDLRLAAVRRGSQNHTVWALQTCFVYHGHDLAVDGDFGPNTERSVRLWQEGRDLIVDGIAGPVTQRSLVLIGAQRSADKYGLIVAAHKGQLLHESSGLVGIHTPRYHHGGGLTSYDAGVAQCNSRYHHPEDAFTLAYALTTLASFTKVRYLAYSKSDPLRASRLQSRGLSPLTKRRRWELAHGSWNRPAYAAWLAGQSTTDPVAPAGAPTAEQRAQLEAYIRAVTPNVNWSAV